MNRPVRLIYTRSYDVKTTSKRHPFRAVYKVIRTIANAPRIIGILWWCAGRYLRNPRVNDPLRNKVDRKPLPCEDGWKGDVS